MKVESCLQTMSQNVAASSCWLMRWGWVPSWQEAPGSYRSPSETSWRRAAPEACNKGAAPTTSVSRAHGSKTDVDLNGSPTTRRTWVPPPRIQSSNDGVGPSRKQTRSGIGSQKPRAVGVAWNGCCRVCGLSGSRPKNQRCSVRRLGVQPPPPRRGTALTHMVVTCDNPCFPNSHARRPINDDRRWTDLFALMARLYYPAMFMIQKKRQWHPRGLRYGFRQQTTCPQGQRPN